MATVDDTIDQIGERLRKAREKAELTMDDVVFQTRLPRAVIHALEADNFSHFTSPVYAKSFLAQYSAFLNVDPTPWLDALKPSSFIEGDPLLPLLEPSGPPPTESLSRQQSSTGWMSAVWLLALTCGLVLAAMKVFQFFEARFGIEVMLDAEDAAADSAATAPTPVPATEVPDSTSEAVPESPPAEDDSTKQAPRAIIVR